MDVLGNIIIKRTSNSDVFIRGWDKESNSLSDEIIELDGELEYDKSVALFDMKKFQAGIARELRSAYPDRRRLENQCICAIAFVKDAPDVLDLCSWILVINIVALDLLKSRFPTMSTYGRVGFDFPLGSTNAKNTPKLVSIFEQDQPLQTRISSDDDSLPSTPSSSSAPKNATMKRSSDKTKKGIIADSQPPELPPRDYDDVKKSKSKTLPQAIKSLVKESKSKNSNQQHESNTLKHKMLTLSTRAKKDDKSKENDNDSSKYNFSVLPKAFSLRSHLISHPFMCD